MSLEALSSLNRPSIVSALGAATLAVLERPGLVGLTSLPSPGAVKTALVASYLLNVISVSLPGRIDGEVAKAIDAEDAGGTAADVSEEAAALSPRTGRSLVTPAGWAFAIWGPIFLGEFLSVSTAAFVLSPSHPLLPLFRKIALPFAAANVFQSLWCASFREKYSAVRGGMMVSTAMLAATAWSLGRADAAWAAASGTRTYGFGQYVLYFFPMALHFGWTTAAALVNLNGAVALEPSSTPETRAAVGIGSAVAAAAGGVALSLARGAPVFSGVISWALFAVADGMRKRIESGRDGEDAEGMYGARWQFWVSTVGAWLCAGVTLVVGYRVISAQRGYTSIESN
mmetsp:Transcript_38398/g.89270  ORF Transcript_38398/g.89270 Transcript_38398/m.89270 type:complete len:342 (-) Transcript_38398:127-1152(-)|eukprot:CAMPEP_0113311164 /NCGR_PEP_ID=MMETSP0010_2-20120614/8509_1 /TAXON_ID=216773 ORGANISM="Corethron hystrix, Strain 308" /NCGR_SAMPLE_ID=MMETSP0010_2 /ASSEMBLY_ACC=CAM_ASM_000155 /LENGTH=341 /DNA_ID=CAMNT_0000166745 /DNA_START=173 /DNA_END=1198 /DNA_ORIENTATION=+ /assembly_acc=CAM_ASM_000155